MNYAYRRTLPFVSALLVAALATGVVATRATSERGTIAPRVPPGVANQGTAVSHAEVSVRELDVLRDVGALGRIALMRKAEGVAFYRIDNTARGTCYSTGPASSVIFGTMACTGTFPSEREPVLDRSQFTSAVGKSQVRILSMQGFAADGVARVAILDTDGVRYSTPVVGNTYALSRDKLPTQSVSTIAAYSSDGALIYERALAGN